MSTDTSSQVSWQSAFWSLVPLALNTMLQPSGRVCGFRPELRTYLRSSPLICAADSISTLIRFAIYSIRLNSPFSGAKATLDTRFQGQSSSGEGLQALERTTLVRWVMGFILGALPQFIKLVGLQGVPWTTAWGCMYITEFCLIEILGLLSLLAKAKQPTTATLIAKAVDEGLHTVDMACGTTALVGQTVLGAWAIKSLLSQFWFASIILVDFVYSMAPSVILRFMVFSTIFGIVVLGACLVVSYFIYVILVSTIVNVFLVLVLGCFGAMALFLLGPIFSENFTLLLFDVCFCFHAQFFAWLAVFQLATYLSRYSGWRHQALLLSADGQNIAAERVKMAAYSFAMFILSFILVAFWYAWRFDPQNTFKPDWTNRFG
jgi:hypothetical protein